MILSLMVLGAAATATTSSFTAIASVIGLLFYVGAYQVSFGPIAWLIVGEIFPLTVRGTAVAISTLTNFGSNALVSQILPSVQTAFGQGNTYFLFAFIATLALVSTFYLVPETKG